MENFFLLHFEQPDALEFKKGLSMNDSLTYDDLNNHYLNPVKVPPRQSKYKLTIVWDLDQTLVNADGIPPEDPRAENTKLIIRPHAEKVLNILRSLPEMEFIIWTAGTESHAKRVVNSFRPGLFDHVISRSRWSYPIKDLNKLVSTGRSLDTMILIDDRMDVGEPHPENLLIIPAYWPETCGPDDTTMLYLANIVYRAYLLFIQNKGKIPFRNFLHSPLTQKCIEPDLDYYYYGIKCFKSQKELEARIKQFD